MVVFSCLTVQFSCDRSPWNLFHNRRFRGQPCKNPLHFRLHARSLAHESSDCCLRVHRSLCQVGSLLAWLTEPREMPYVVLSVHHKGHLSTHQMDETRGLGVGRKGYQFSCLSAVPASRHLLRGSGSPIIQGLSWGSPYIGMADHVISYEVTGL